MHQNDAGKPLGKNAAEVSEIGDAAQAPLRRGRGRPRGSKNKPKTDGLTLSEQIALEESQRVVQEGSNLTAMQVVNRAQIKTGIKGGTNAQKAHLERIAKLEQKQRDARDAFLNGWEEYVIVAEELLERASPEQRAALEPGMLPHPADVEVDFRKCEVRVRGPATSLERRQWNELKREIEWARSTVLASRARLESNPTNETMQIHYLSVVSRYLDTVDLMPERHRPEALPEWPASKTIPFWFDREGDERTA